MTAAFEQVDANNVKVGLQSSLDVNSEFFGYVTFHFNPDKTLTGVSQNGGSPVESISWGLDSQDSTNLPGGGNEARGSDIMINFENPNGGGHFQGTDFISFVFTDPGITPADLDFFNADGELKIAAKVQGIPGCKSGAITDEATDDGTTVPDGGYTLILLGIGTTLCALARRTISL